MIYHSRLSFALHCAFETIYGICCPKRGRKRGLEGERIVFYFLLLFYPPFIILCPSPLRVHCVVAVSII